jgi:hypothetical protein
MTVRRIGLRQIKVLDRRVIGGYTWRRWKVDIDDGLTLGVEELIYLKCVGGAKGEKYMCFIQGFEMRRRQVWLRDV